LLRANSDDCVLVVDEDALFCMALSRHLSALGLEVRATPDSAEALAFLHDARPALVFIDVDLPGCGGLRTAELAASLHARAMIVLTARDASAVARARQSRPNVAVAVVEKPISLVQARQLAEVAMLSCGRPSPTR
jgi:CheY-like chemotaxis protein